MSDVRYKGCHHFIVPMPDGPGQGCPWCIMTERDRYKRALEEISLLAGLSPLLADKAKKALEQSS